MSTNLESYKQSQNISWSINHAVNKQDSDVEDICTVFKNDREVEDEDSPLIKSMGEELQLLNGKLVLTLMPADFGVGKILPNVKYEVGIAIKYINDAIWKKYDFPSTDDGEIVFEYPRINK